MTTGGSRGSRGVGGTPAAAVIGVGVEKTSRDRFRTPSKGLVASLQAVYEPLVVGGIRVGNESPGAHRLASSPLPCTGSAMLARPWQQQQQQTGALHGSESASSPPPLSKSSAQQQQQLGAAAVAAATTATTAAASIRPSIEGFSSSQTRSVRGRSPGPFPLASPLSPTDVSANVTRSSVNGVNNGSHGSPDPATKLNHTSTTSSTTIPTRRLSEPNRTSRRTSITTSMVEETRLKNSATLSPVDMVDNKVKGLSKGGLAYLKGMSGNRDNEDEELQYGPGIVNKLKSRYLSRTLRERPLGESRRPSLRRAASLEDWLDKDSSASSQHSNVLIPNDGTFPVLVRNTARAKNERPVSLNLAAQTSVESKSTPSSSNTSSPTKLRDTKKARSVDYYSQPAWRSVSVSDLVVSPSQSTARPSASQTVQTPTSPKTPVHLLLSKDAIVIVEKDDSSQSVDSKTENAIKSKTTIETPPAPPAPPPTTPSTGLASRPRRSLLANSRYNVEEAELPPPDTVRQVKRLFESGSSRKAPTRRSQSAGPGVNRVPLSATSQPTEKLSIQRMNQVNLVNNKQNVSSVAARKKSDPTTPRITELTADTKPVVITKPSPIGPKPAVLSPKPTVVAATTANAVDKPRAVQSVPTGASTIQRTIVPPKPAVAAAVATTPVVAEIPIVKKDSSDQSDDEVDRRASGDGFKIISKTALDNIHKESISVQFSFDGKKEIDSKNRVDPIKDDGKDDKSPPLSTGQSKQVGVIRPQLKSPTIQSDKPVVFSDDVTSKISKNIDSKDNVVKKEELILSPTPTPVTTTTSIIGVAKTQPKTEIIAQSQTTKLANVPSVSTVKYQPVSRPTKQSQQPAAAVGSHSASQSELISPATDPLPSSPASSVSTSVAPIVDQKPTETILVSTPAVKIPPPSSSISSPNNKLTPNNGPTSSPAVISTLSPSSNAAREQKKQWHQPETTTVFNFVNDKSRNTDHIRNDGGSTGILVYKVIFQLVILFSPFKKFQSHP